MSLTNALRTPSSFAGGTRPDPSTATLRANNTTPESTELRNPLRERDVFASNETPSRPARERSELSALERPMVSTDSRPHPTSRDGLHTNGTISLNREAPSSPPRGATPPAVEVAAESRALPLANSATETEDAKTKDSFWTWQNILPKVAIAIGTITLGIALFNTAAAAPALIKANGVLAGLGKIGAAFVSNLGQAFLYVVVTPFVAAYEGLRATAIVLKDVIAAGAKLLWKGISTTASFTWNNLIVPTARFLQPAAEFVWTNVIVKSAVFIKDAVVWTVQNVIRPVFEFIGPALKFAWDNVLYPVLDATFWAIGKVFEGVFWTLGKVLEGTFNVLSFLYTNAMVPVSRFIRSVAGALGRALAPAASWVFNNVLAPVGRGIATAAVASYQYVIAPVASALGSAAQSVASGIAAAWRTVAQTISAIFA